MCRDHDRLGRIGGHCRRRHQSGRGRSQHKFADRFSHVVLPLGSLTAFAASLTADRLRAFWFLVVPRLLAASGGPLAQAAPTAFAYRFPGCASIESSISSTPRRRCFGGPGASHRQAKRIVAKAHSMKVLLTPSISEPGWSVALIRLQVSSPRGPDHTIFHGSLFRPAFPA